MFFEETLNVTQIRETLEMVDLRETTNIIGVWVCSDSFSLRDHYSGSVVVNIRETR